MKRIIFLTAICTFCLQAVSQTISPQVLNAAGDHRQVGNSGVWITDNVGEPFTTTIDNASNMMITQGFIQPETITKGGFTLNPIQQSLKCLDKEDDAFISLALTSTVNKYTAQYFWSPANVCPTNDCAKIDTLKPGIYTVTVAITYTTNIGAVRNDTIVQSFVIDPASEPCFVKVYSGISANFDRVNDFFTVENIKEYPNNHVSIYNRWGQLLFDIKGYDHDMEGKRWPTDDELTKLVPSTYFYIVELGNGSRPLKGWVELIKN